MLESRAERIALGVSLSGRHSSTGSRRSLEFSESKNPTLLTLLNCTSKQTNRLSTMFSHKKSVSICTNSYEYVQRDLFLRPGKNLKLGIGCAEES